MPGTKNCLILSFERFSTFAIFFPVFDPIRLLATPVFNSLYAFPSRISFRYLDRPPTFLPIDILLSLMTTTHPVFNCARPFNASYAIPPVRDPSPITTATFSSPPRRSLAIEYPIAAEIPVELCPVSNASHGLSLRFGNPLKPSYCRSVSNASFLPVRI